MSNEAQTPLPSQPLPPYRLPISLEAAKRVMATADAEARARGWALAIAIVDTGGHLVLFQKADQTNLGAVVFAQRKAESAVLFRRATKVHDDLVTNTPSATRLFSLGPKLGGRGQVLVVAGRRPRRRLVTFAAAGLLFMFLTLVQPSPLLGLPLVVALAAGVWLGDRRRDTTKADRRLTFHNAEGRGT